MAGFNVDEFRAVVNRGGIMKANRFLVRIPMPVGLQGSRFSQRLSETARNLEFYCDSANLPGVAMTTWDHTRYGYGPSEKRPVRPVFTDAQLQFRADAKGDVRSFFSAWLNVIHNFDARQGMNPASTTGLVRGIEMGTYETSYKYEYAVDMEVVAFSDDGKPRLGYLLREAYPLFIADNALDWGAVNTALHLPVSFTFFDWFTFDPNSPVTAQ